MEYLNTNFQQDGSSAFMAWGELPENHIRGEGIVFGGIVDAYMPTIFYPGAFAKTLQERKRAVLLLWDHDEGEPIGKPNRLIETSEGLAFESMISKTARGKDALQLVRDGVVDSLSIGFDVIKEDFEHFADGSMLRHVREVKLWEISLVAWGADANAKIREVNSAFYNGHHVLSASLEKSKVHRCVDLPVAGSDYQWSASDAARRVEVWAKGKELLAAQAYLYQNGSLIADVVDEKLCVVPEALYAAYAEFEGSRGGMTLTDTERQQVRMHLSHYFVKMGASMPSVDNKPSVSQYSSTDYAYLMGKHILALVAAGKEKEALCLFRAEPALPLTHDVDNRLLDAELAMKSMLIN